MATILLGLFFNEIVDASYRCQTAILLFHFQWKGNGHLYVTTEWDQGSRTGP